MWERRSHAFPSHYTPRYKSYLGNKTYFTLPKFQTQFDHFGRLKECTRQTLTWLFRNESRFAFGRFCSLCDQHTVTLLKRIIVIQMY